MEFLLYECVELMATVRYLSTLISKVGVALALLYKPDLVLWLK
jgi:hypothetical protein